jgi:phosphatidate cytidylyltransferase
MLATRIVTALVLFALVLAALFLLPPMGWALVTLAGFVIASVEWANLAGFERARKVGFVAGVLFFGLVLLFGAGFDRGWPAPVVLALCGTATAFWLLVAPSWLARRSPPPWGWLLAIAGGVVLLATWVALVELQARSPWLVLAAMALVWIADTAAYFAGRALGRHKLAPQISPGKSWEGVYGALVAVAAYALALTPLARRAGFSGDVTPIAIAAFVVLSLALAAISVVGDLTESLLKRHAGVKDSGAILPGHGGVLDRIDALLAAMPMAALAALLFLR